MLVRLGERRDPDDVVGQLGGCHVRIRRFLQLARDLARSTPPPAEAREAAVAIRRYFVEALPLHVADEEELITPRLRGRSPELDAALAAMKTEHAAHEAPVAHLVALCTAIERDPSTIPSELATLAASLETELDRHLVAEERIIFPAVRELPPADQSAIRAAMRERRER
jgi:iron-sulfur cluster repair protein YtfE (RIC family)